MEKHYLYHKVPKPMEGDILYPLNQLKEKDPALYAQLASKYAGREHVMDQTIDMLDGAAWNDVIHMSAVHPAELKAALLEAGVDENELKEMEFFQIDPDTLDPEQTVIFLHTPHSKEFIGYDSGKLNEHASVPEWTKRQYREKTAAGEKPLYFLGIPHILHKGQISVRDLPILKV